MTIVEKLEALGWDVETASLYDEEAAEGWVWSNGDRELVEIGAWDEPPVVPDELLALVGE